MDAKAIVKVGPCARGGKKRVQVDAADHDGKPLAPVTPVGLFLPTLEERLLYGVPSQGPSDCLGDRLTQGGEAVCDRFAPIPTLVLKLDNGPEKHRRRTQGMQRLVALVPQYPLTVRLAYTPPSHSKDTPLERCGGFLETHWPGTLLDSIDTVLQCARTMTWHGQHPVVAVVTTTYQTGITWTKDAMETVEAQLKRLPDLGQWFIDIVSPSLVIRDT
jgi:hypothetical protein